MKDGRICSNSRVSVKDGGDVLTVSISGNFDSSTTPLIHECCKKVQNRKGVRKIVLDFEKVTRADTTAFACIISFIKEHMGSAVEISVANLHEPQEELLRMLKIEKIVRVI